MILPIPEASPETELEQEPEETPLYYRISFDRLAELERDAVTLLAARRGPAAPSLVQADHELDDPQALLEEIAEFAAPEPDFIRSELPVQEIIFRTLLARRNEPMALKDLCYELTERWSVPERPINLTPGNLQRILDHDHYYGFAREELAAEE